MINSYYPLVSSNMACWKMGQRNRCDFPSARNLHSVRRCSSLPCLMTPEGTYTLYTISMVLQIYTDLTILCTTYYRLISSTYYIQHTLFSLHIYIFIHGQPISASTHPSPSKPHHPTARSRLSSKSRRISTWKNSRRTPPTPWRREEREGREVTVKFHRGMAKHVPYSLWCHQTWLAGKFPRNGGKIGKSPINAPFSIAMFDHQRVMGISWDSVGIQWISN